MSIESIGTLSPSAAPDAIARDGAIGGGRGARGIAPGADVTDGVGSFTEALGGAIGKVDDIQRAADAEAEKVALGGGNLHEMSLALEKADVSMRLAMKVRSKLVEAYQEIMRMGV